MGDGNMKPRQLEDVTEQVENRVSFYNLYRGTGENRNDITLPQRRALAQMEFGKWYERGSFSWETLNALVSKRMVIEGRSTKYEGLDAAEMLLTAIFTPDNNDPHIIYRLATQEDFK
jgi:hypothetical protein